MTLTIGYLDMIASGVTCIEQLHVHTTRVVLLADKREKRQGEKDEGEGEEEGEDDEGMREDEGRGKRREGGE